MNTMINKTLTIFFTLLLMGTLVATVDAQETDFEIQEQFNEDYQQIVRMIDRAETLGDLQSAQDRVNQLLSDFRQHREVVNRGIYPETISERIEGLREKFMPRLAKIRTIERQDRSITRLRSELTRTRDRMDRYDLHISWLLERVVELEGRALSAEADAASLNEAVRQRDRFVTEFLTDLLERFEAVDAATRQEMTEIFERLEDSPIDLLQNLLGEHLAYAQDTAGLTPTDLLNMKAQHTFFNNWWEQFGERFVNTFEPQQPGEVYSELNSRMSDWQSAVDGQLWGAISDTYAQHGFELSSFNSASEYNSALQSFISEQTEIARERGGGENIERFREFSDFWNESVKSEWGDALTASDVMSHSQIAAIDRQLIDWSQATAPERRTGNLMLVLFLISLAVNIGLVVALVRQNKNPAATS
jgi:uncharacterized coiled-coil protein SlyX